MTRSAPERFLVTGMRAWRGRARPASSMVVSDGRIAEIGGPRVAQRADAEGIPRIDLGGRRVTPGFIDAHVHPLAAQLQREGRTVSPDASVEECWDAVRQAVAETTGWVVLTGYSAIRFAASGVDRADLDLVERHRPVVLVNSDQHGALANTAALAAAGIPLRGSGLVERDEAGEATGYVHEDAMTHLLDHAPQPDAAALERALLDAQRTLHGLGVIGWQDAFLGSTHGMPDATSSYLALAAAGRLTARVTGALGWDRSAGLEQIEELVERRSAASATGFGAPAVKFFVDGVLETGTAAMLHDYFDVAGQPLGHDGGTAIEPALLHAAVQRLDALDFDLHFHAVGDRAVRAALDAVEHARAHNGHRGTRHQIAHVMFVGEGDAARFADLDVTMNIQSVWAAPEFLDFAQYERYVGAEPMRRLFQLADWQASGARMAIGSDWPVSDPDPLAAIHGAVHRSLTGDCGERFGGQRLDRDHAWIASTRGSAWAARIPGSGSLEVGAWADLVVWSGDPLYDHASAHVEQTWAGGVPVHGAELFAQGQR